MREKPLSQLGRRIRRTARALRKVGNRTRDEYVRSRMAGQDPEMPQSHTDLELFAGRSTDDNEFIGTLLELGRTTVYRYTVQESEPAWLDYTLLGVMVSVGDRARARELLEEILQVVERGKR